jgi:ABC-type transport system substrate-binding protein
VVGLLLPLVEPAFPRWMGLGVALLAALLLATSAVAKPARRVLLTQWRDARKPFAAVTSALLSVVIVTTTLFITKPTIFLGPQHLGYDFSYTYHAPTHKGGAITVGLLGYLGSLVPGEMGVGESFGVGNGCVTHLPDLTLGLPGYKPDQCTEVPTIANGGESPDYKTTIFRIDPRAVWSDGKPITADDYLFAYHLDADPNIAGGGFPMNQIQQLTALDARTVRIDWSVGFAEYLEILHHTLLPIPLHAYATGSFAGMYDPKSGAYNSVLAQQLVASPSFNAAMPVDNGPFTVQSFVPNSRAVLVRNPRFFSNFFHAPALDKVTFVSVNPQWPQGPPEAQSVDTLVTQYRQGAVDLVEGLSSLDLSRLGGIPKTAVITSPVIQILDIGFNQRAEALNAQANGGVSIFADKNVCKAFVEAFDRCAAVRAQLGISNCADPNLFTDELTAPPAQDHDPSVKLPGYNPADAARLMDRAGYPVVDGIRRNKDGKTPLQISIDLPPGGAQAPLIGQRMQQDYRRNLKIRVTLESDPHFFVSPVPQTMKVVTGAFDIAFYEDDGAPALVWNAQLILGPTDSADITSTQNLAGSNFLGVIDPWVVKQEQLGAETQDYDQRASVFRDVKGHIAQQFYLEPVFIKADVALVKPTLCNFKKWPYTGDNAWNMADWYVAPSCP